MTNNQHGQVPEALRLADAIRTHKHHPQYNLMKRAADKLCELHAQVAALTATPAQPATA